MTGIEARDLLDTEIKEFQCSNDGQIGTFYMSECFALDLMKCKRGELPNELLENYNKMGTKVLEVFCFCGFPVVLESGDDGFRIELNDSPDSDGDTDE